MVHLKNVEQRRKRVNARAAAEPVNFFKLTGSRPNASAVTAREIDAWLFSCNAAVLLPILRTAQSKEDSMNPRTVKRTVRGQNAVDGAGVRLVRVVGHRDVKDFDPFLLLDAFDSTNPDDYVRGFPLHPHRGIETITYLAEGLIEHEDSLGNKGAIRSGDCQWMTAGRGILHQEMPKPSPRMLGLQFWLNLSPARKMVPPKYRDITAAGLPVVHEPGAVIRIIAGDYKGKTGTVMPDHTPARLIDLRLEPGATWEWPLPPDDTAFIYILAGSVYAAGEPEEHGSHQALLFGEGDGLRLKAGATGALLVAVCGTPLREPVAWGGPIVMNTDDELRQAFQELEDGTFISRE